MERTLSPDEKIKRAEEIYYRRKMNMIDKNFARVNVYENKKRFSLFKKVFLQLLICMVIYTIFYMIRNTEYIFSEDVINKTKEILSYDINIQKIYNELKLYLNSYIQANENKNEEEPIQEEQNTQIEDIPQNEENVNENIGGENIVDVEVPVTVSQMEQDAKDILETKSLILPLRGTITSRFGNRESTNPIVSKNHTGIDIAVNEGTVFVASMSGKVEEVSNKRRTG